VHRERLAAEGQPTGHAQMVTVRSDRRRSWPMRAP
jgi:hypothetical protein